MSLTDLISQVEFLVDTAGNKKSVVVELAVWEELLAALEQPTPKPSAHTVMGKYAFVKTSSEDFARRKQQEIELER